MPRKTALILSGGGAKGAFQAAAEKYAREVKGYRWDVIAGVSVGALNASMLAMGKYQRLMEIWNTISDDQVYTGGFNLLSLARLLFGAKSFYGNEPLWKRLQSELEPDKIRTDLRIGAVSLVTGEYVQFRWGSSSVDKETFARAVLASTAMPIVWEPVDVAPQYRAMVDGGVRNISPLGDVLDSNPDEVIVINCSPRTIELLPGPPANVLQIGQRTLDILLTELFINDLSVFLRINALVKEARSQGVTLHNPRNGKPLKYYDCKIIEPETPLGDTLDFSQASIQRSLQAGLQRAQQVLGK